ncbi:hypothetical protein KP509_12G019800 [Ceratopteris richardii]|nr:hypothetical protein KP509_12G019800 [Ceratopteris richardii]
MRFVGSLLPPSPTKAPLSPTATMEVSADNPPASIRALHACPPFDVVCHTANLNEAGLSTMADHILPLHHSRVQTNHISTSSSSHLDGLHRSFNYALEAYRRSLPKTTSHTVTSIHPADDAFLSNALSANEEPFLVSQRNTTTHIDFPAEDGAVISAFLATRLDSERRNVANMTCLAVTHREDYPQLDADSTCEYSLPVADEEVSSYGHALTDSAIISDFLVYLSVPDLVNVATPPTMEFHTVTSSSAIDHFEVEVPAYDAEVLSVKQTKFLTLWMKFLLMTQKFLSTQTKQLFSVQIH